MWIKLHHQNTFTCLEFPSLMIFDKRYVLKYFVKLKIINAPAGFELMTFRFENYALNNRCATHFGSKFGK